MRKSWALWFGLVRRNARLYVDWFSVAFSIRQNIEGVAMLLRRWEDGNLNLSDESLRLAASHGFREKIEGRRRGFLSRAKYSESSESGRWGLFYCY